MTHCQKQGHCAVLSGRTRIPRFASFEHQRAARRSANWPPKPRTTAYFNAETARNICSARGAKIARHAHNELAIERPGARVAECTRSQHTERRPRYRSISPRKAMREVGRKILKFSVGNLE